MASAFRQVIRLPFYRTLSNSSIVSRRFGVKRLRGFKSKDIILPLGQLFPELTEKQLQMGSELAKNAPAKFSPAGISSTAICTCPCTNCR